MIGPSGVTRGQVRLNLASSSRSVISVVIDCTLFTMRIAHLPAVVHRTRAAQQFQIAEDRSQWRAQVVRDGRHELALNAVQLFEVCDVLHHGDLAHALDGRHVRVERARAISDAELRRPGVTGAPFVGEQFQQALVIGHRVKALPAHRGAVQAERRARGVVAQ